MTEAFAVRSGYGAQGASTRRLVGELLGQGVAEHYVATPRVRSPSSMSPAQALTHGRNR